jgi:hypothetical protein
VNVICPRCSFYFAIEISGRRQQAECPQCGAFAAAPDPEGGLVIKLVCRRCAVGYPVDVGSARGAVCCPICGAEPKRRDRDTLAKLKDAWRLRRTGRPEAEQEAAALVNLDEMDLTPKLVQRVPRSLALAYTCVPIRFENDVLTVAMPERVQRGVLEDLAFVLRCTVQGAAASRVAVQRALDRCYGRGGGELHA